MVFPTVESTMSTATLYGFAIMSGTIFDTIEPLVMLSMLLITPGSLDTIVFALKFIIPSTIFDVSFTAPSSPFKSFDNSFRFLSLNSLMVLSPSFSIYASKILDIILGLGFLPSYFLLVFFFFLFSFSLYDDIFSSES